MIVSACPLEQRDIAGGAPKAATEWRQLCSACQGRCARHGKHHTTPLTTLKKRKRVLSADPVDRCATGTHRNNLNLPIPV